MLQSNSSKPELNLIHEANRDFLLGQSPIPYNIEDIRRKIYQSIQPRSLLDNISFVVIGCVGLILGATGIVGFIDGCKDLFFSEKIFSISAIYTLGSIVLAAFVTYISYYIMRLVALNYSSPTKENVEQAFQQFIKNNCVTEGRVIRIQRRIRINIQYEYTNNKGIVLTDKFSINTFKLNIQNKSYVTVVFSELTSILL
jgi:hypothetical protein